VAELRRAGLTYLARREHSTWELTHKLRAKGFTASEIDQGIAALTAEGLLSDTRYIENYIHARHQKGYGPLKIEAELLARGIPKELIEHQLKIADNAWFALAKKSWHKRFKGILPCDYKLRAQQMRFLHSRGFTSEQIENIFSSDHDDA
jgi:regulatory protein